MQTESAACSLDDSVVCLHIRRQPNPPLEDESVDRNAKLFNNSNHLAMKAGALPVL